MPRVPPFETWGTTAISRSLLTDHRIGLTLHQLAEIMEGRLQPVIDAVVAHFQAERLKAETANIALIVASGVWNEIIVFHWVYILPA